MSHPHPANPGKSTCRWPGLSVPRSDLATKDHGGKHQRENYGETEEGFSRPTSPLEGEDDEPKDEQGEEDLQRLANSARAAICPSHFATRPFPCG